MKPEKVIKCSCNEKQCKYLKIKWNDFLSYTANCRKGREVNSEFKDDCPYYR
jgi:hypothetical protein